MVSIMLRNTSPCPAQRKKIFNLLIMLVIIMMILRQERWAVLPSVLLDDCMRQRQCGWHTKIWWKSYHIVCSCITKCMWRPLNWIIAQWFDFVYIVWCHKCTLLHNAKIEKMVSQSTAVALLINWPHGSTNSFPSI